MSYLYPVPANKLLDLVGSKIHLYWAKPGSEYTLVKVEGNRIHTLDSFGIKGTFNAKDACYTAKNLPTSLSRG